MEYDENEVPVESDVEQFQIHLLHSAETGIKLNECLEDRLLHVVDVFQLQVQNQKCELCPKRPSTDLFPAFVKDAPRNDASSNTRPHLEATFVDFCHSCGCYDSSFVVRFIVTPTQPCPDREV